MNKIRKLFERLLSTTDDFRVLVFMVLAVSGSLICMITSVTSVALHTSPLNIGANLASLLISLSLLFYTYRTGNYRVSYWVTIVVIFWIMFPVLFFTSGGIHSGMNCFFIFAVMFTVYMLGGLSGFAAGTIEVLIYSACCIAAVRHPGLVTPQPTEEDLLFDVILSLVTTSSALGITLLVQFRIYASQQEKLKNALDEAELQSRAKGIFLASMSHEIRTPISIILSNSEMIGRYSSDERVLDLSRNIETSGEYLLSLLSNVLDISKIESGKMDINNVSYRLGDLASELELIGQELASRKELSFRTIKNYEPSAALYGDRSHIRQIAANLIGNAVKYTMTGMVSVTVSYSPDPSAEEEGSGLLRISVADTGIGIKEKDLESIFDTFSRGSVSDNRFEGTGLGLSIVKQLTELLNGRITVTSEYGKGSVFTVEIPQQLSKGTDPGYEEVSLREYVAPKGRILAVDDTEENLKILKLLLEKLLVSIDTARSGREGLELAKKNQYDIIILDYMMPEMDGISTLHAMKAAGVEAAFIVLTANAVAGTEGKLLEAGFSAYISKPVRSRELEQKLLRFLPEDKVSYVAEEEAFIADAGNLYDLENIVAGLDVDVKSGLKLVYNNLDKYGKICALYAESCDYYREEADRFHAAKDWGNMIYSIHSLKSRALGIGALRLGSFAKILEDKLRQQDEDYIASSYPLLCLEWNRSAAAARLISGYTEKLFSSVSAADSETVSALLAEARTSVEANVWYDACECLKKLLEADPLHRDLYEKALRAADELNFEKAGELLSKI